MTTFQETLTSVIKVYPNRYEERQPYLAAVLKAIDKAEDADYDTICDVHSDFLGWHEAAVQAVDERDPIPDYPDYEAVPDEEVSDDTDGEVPSRDETEEKTEAGNDTPDTEEVSEDRPEVVQKPPRRKSKTQSPEVTAKIKAAIEKSATITGDKNKYGIVKGTKSEEVLFMFEKGCTMAHVHEKMGANFYNLLKKMVSEGHLIEKLEGGIWKLTHKSEVQK